MHTLNNYFQIRFKPMNLPPKSFQENSSAKVTNSKKNSPQSSMKKSEPQSKTNSCSSSMKKGKNNSSMLKPCGAKGSPKQLKRSNRAKSNKNLSKTKKTATTQLQIKKVPTECAKPKPSSSPLKKKASFKASSKEHSLLWTKSRLA